MVCEAPGYAEWLDEVLIPSFTRVAFDPDAVTVIVGDKPDESGSSLPHAFPLGTRPCFVFEHEVISHDAWRVGDHIEVVDGKYEVRYIVGPTHVRVEVGNRGTGARAAVLRVIRELALAQSLANGERVMLHASGLEREGKVVLFTGPKEAGKTTLVTRLASATGAGLLANDCALLSPSEPRSRNWDVHAVPFPVSVRADTVRRFPELFRDVPAIKRPSRPTLAEADVARTEHGTVTEPARLRLSTPQFARALRVPLSAGGQLASLAFVTVDPDITGFRLVPLPPSDAPKFVRVAVYGPAERTTITPSSSSSSECGDSRLPTRAGRGPGRRGRQLRCAPGRPGGA